MGRIDRLAERYRRYISLPWERDLAGAQRMVFVVYDKTDERRLRAPQDALRTGDKGRRPPLDRVRPDRCVRRVDGERGVSGELLRVAGGSRSQARTGVPRACRQSGSEGAGGAGVR